MKYFPNYFFGKSLAERQDNPGVIEMKTTTDDKERYPLSEILRRDVC